MGKKRECNLYIERTGKCFETEKLCLWMGYLVGCEVQKEHDRKLALAIRGEIIDGLHENRD